jgi:undecaprenyl-diphosphatase
LTPFAALVLGTIQGLTEFLPVSSSAHLALTHWLTGWTHTPAEDLVFDVVLHFGTLVAILVYFARDWISFIQRGDKLLGYVIVACIPGGIAGVLLEGKAETIFRDPLRIALMLAVMGLVMAAAERFSRREKTVEQMGWGDALWIGVLQALAIMPGVSRSGITMTTGLFRGLTREAAARFSFLLATPIMLGATLWSARHLVSGEVVINSSVLVTGMLAAAVTGFACIHFLLRFLQRHTFYAFVIYRLALAASVVAIVLVGSR